MPDYKDKPEDYPRSRVEYWLYNLVNMETMTTPLPFQSQQPIFGKVGGISELGHMSDEEHFKYQSSLDMYRTNVAVIQNERAEGRAEAVLSIAKQLIKMGMSTNQISQATGLSVEEIKAI